MSDALLTIADLSVHFPGDPLGGGPPGGVAAVEGVNLELRSSEILALVGESGCGKTTLARSLLGLVRPSRGSIRFEGQELTSLSARAWRPARRRLQMVFQDAEPALDPRLTIEQSVGEGLAIHRIGAPAEWRERVAALLKRVGLPEQVARCLPAELSGGQRQRVGVARALAVDPVLLIADEATSALDATVQVQILELFAELKASQGLACLFVTHDLREVAYLSDRVAVMHQGRIVEVGPTREVLDHPRDPYTQALLASRFPQGPAPNAVSLGAP